jgi:hypothetical protein
MDRCAIDTVLAEARAEAERIVREAREASS